MQIKLQKNRLYLYWFIY